MILYDYAASQNAWKVRCLASSLKLPLETRWVSIFEGQSHTPEFVRRNPAGAVPVLELDDGDCIAESNAILAYLARDTRFLPAAPRLHAKTLQWLFYEQDHVQSTIATLRYWVLTGKDANRGAQELQRRRHGSAEVLRVLDGFLALHDWLVEWGPTIADIAVYAYVHRADEAGFDFTGYPSLAAWCTRFQSAFNPLPEVIPYSVDPHSQGEL